MRINWSLLVSFAAHAAILLFALVALPAPKEHKISEPPPIAVNIEDFQDVTKRANQTTEPVKQELKPDETPKVQKVEKKIDKPSPKPAKEIKQAAREPQAQPEPKPEPKPAETQPDPTPLEELIKKTQDVSPDPAPQDEQKQQQARAVPKPRVKPAPPKKVEKPKKQEEFKLDDIAALLNKTDDDKAAPTDQTETGTPLVGDQNLTGNDQQVTATALDWLRQRVGQCWSIPAGARDADQLIVTLRFQLDIDGRIVGQPYVERTTSHPAAAAAASSAMAALIQCQPYDKMPRETHDLWADIRMNFDPSVMVGLN